ncbi:MAG: hypothetical protein U0359_31030 [Byssovorax sp.]
MLTFPPPPEVPAEQRTTTEVAFRYEDASQDGRLLLPSLAFGLGESVWSKLLQHHPAAPGMRKAGIVPILSRLIVEGTPGPFAPVNPLTVEGRYDLARAEKNGAVERILLDMWVELRAPLGHIQSFLRPPSRDVAVAGRVFAEHVFTRLFAAPADRKVLRLDLPGFPAIPETVAETRPPAALLGLPEGAVPLDEAPAVDPTLIAFGLCHTDANQHVNSLVYPQMFEEAALRRFATLGRAPAGLARFAEIAFRKPFFANDRAKIRLQAFSIGGKLGVAGGFFAEADAARPDALPHTTAQMLFEP